MALLLGKGELYPHLCGIEHTRMALSAILHGLTFLHHFGKS